MAEFLLELFSEEIPARMQARAADDLKRLVTDGLAKAGIGFTHAEAHATARRLALAITGLPLAQPDTAEERRGPRVGAPEKAVEGFLASVGLSLSEVEQRETDKGTFYVATIRRAGRPTSEVLAEIVADAIWSFPWPKSMRWGVDPAKGRSSHLVWVRPLHGLLALLDGDLVPVRLGRDGDDGHALIPGRATRGHRFMGAETFEVTGFEDYRAKLAKHHVMLDAGERRRAILAEAARLAAREGIELVPDDGLLDEVVGLVEWPVPLIGAIDDKFMDLPPEVLSTAMRAHQKYFSLRDPKTGRLAPRFLTVSNLIARDGGQAIVAGNERVLRARLSDARFFWDQDRAQRLDTRVAQLAGIVFHAKLGTLAEKVSRMRLLAAELAPDVKANADLVDRAALLAKADLVTGMVGEFPELQGIMGRYYAEADGEDWSVADAIAAHYRPQGPNDACPTDPVAVTVALADKLDTLAGFFLIDERPTGSKDPFALRRAALGVIRLILDNKLRLKLRPVLAAAVAAHAGAVAAGDPVAVVDALLDFFADRLKVHLREAGVRHDLIAAVFAGEREDDFVRLLARVEALARFLGEEDGANLLAAYRRATNIVRIEAKKDKAATEASALDPSLLRVDEEIQLAERLDEVGRLAKSALAHEEYAAAMGALARLRRPVDAFFDRVTVNADDPALRRNRLALLARIGEALAPVADFSRIEGGTP
jgi:glycyl-tRNA synthetase beta chain